MSDEAESGPRWVMWLVLVLITVSTGFVDLRVRSYPEHPYRQYIPGVINGTSGAPGIYRVLVPYTFDWLQRVSRVSIDTLWHATRLAWIFAGFAAFYVYLRTWFRDPDALAGTLLVAATLPLTFTNSWAHPDQFAELALFTGGCAAVARNRPYAFAALLVLASLNRETAAFLVVLYAVSGDFSRGHVLRTAMFGGLWLAVFAGIRLWRGYESYEYWQLWRNIEFMKLLPPPRDPYYRSYAYFGPFLFGGLFTVAMIRLREKPQFMQRALLVVPVIAVVAFTISSIIETRIFTPLFSLIVPAALSTVTAPARSNSNSR
jgi:hypothetical protein